jgi:hypothetical protein
MDQSQEIQNEEIEIVLPPFQIRSRFDFFGTSILLCI